MYGTGMFPILSVGVFLPNLSVKREKIITFFSKLHYSYLLKNTNFENREVILIFKYFLAEADLMF